MLFHFRTPRTRDWGKYMKKLQKFLESQESTVHLSAYFAKTQEARATLVKLLDECAKDVCRPDDLIKILSEYLPHLEQLIEGVEANNVKLVGVLDVVWTSFLTSDINGKSLSNTLQWEKTCCYTLLGLAHYQKAVELHHLNRQMSHKIKQKVNSEQEEEFDPIFDEAPDVTTQAPQIHDDKSRVKDISHMLKQAAAIWSFAASLLPVLIVESGKNAFQVIPEAFECVLSVLSDMSLVNAQEFMIQLAVQTDKSPALTAKLSAGVAHKLKQCNHSLQSSLSKQVYGSMTRDFILYLKIRSDLYSAIANKYQAKFVKQTEKHGECIAYYQRAINILNHATRKFPVEEHNKAKAKQNQNQGATSSLVVMKKSIDKQMQSVKAMFNAAQSENNAVYFEVVPKQEVIQNVEHKWVMKVAAYQPDWQCL